MAEEKTYVFGEGTSGLNALLPALFSKSGVDPNLLAMMNNGNGMGNNGSWFLWIIVILALFRNGGFGNGGFPANQLNNDYGREMLLQAINGNGNAISQLATTLNCDINVLQSTLTSIQGQIQSIGSQVGMTGQQVINAIQSGNCQLGSQLASCCCDIREAITKQGYENQLATLNQTNILGSKIDQQTTLINDKFCQLEMREMQNKIDALREDKSALINQLSQEHQTNAIQAYQAQTIAPVSAALVALQREVDGIKCKLPESVSVPYSPVIGIPTCVAAQYGLGALGYGNFGPWNSNGSIWA